MKRGIFNLFFAVLLACPLFAWAWSYPVKEVEGAFCGQSGGVCKIELPRISKADYLKYYQLPRYRQIYTVLWGGTYFWGWDFGFWSHQGVDIASPQGTPIYAAGAGEVILAQEKGERGKVIVIKHLWQGKQLYTVYAHLESIKVAVGAQVAEGQQIATMGSSWNSTGPHLHFQIDINEGEHPYFPKGCGGTISEVVNEGKCRDQIRKNTLDPILFLETEGKLFLAEQQKEWSQISAFLSPYALDFSLEKSVLMLGAATSLQISSALGSEENFLAEELRFEASNMEIFPKQLSYLGTGRIVHLRPQNPGLHQLHIRSGSHKIKTLSLFVLDEQLKAKLEQKTSEIPALQVILDQL